MHNQIIDWSERFTGIPVRNSYCLGVSDGLLTLSKDEKKAAEAQARESEAKALAAKIQGEESESQARLSRLRNPSLEPISEVDSDTEMDADDPDSGVPHDQEANDETADDVSDNEVLPDFAETGNGTSTTINAEADFDTELRKFIPADTPENHTSLHDNPAADSSTKTGDDALQSSECTNEEAIPSEETYEWKSMRQLSVFREMSHDIEDKVLETNKIKLRKGRKKPHSIKNKDAFKEGQRDSKKIEVRAARIEAEDKDGAEAMDLS